MRRTASQSRIPGLRILWVLAAMLAATLCMAGVVYGRYVMTYQEQGVITSQTMYFESDYLTPDGEEYTVSGDTVVFYPSNYPDGLRSSQVDVRYTVEVDDPHAVVSSSEGVLAADRQSRVEIRITGLERGKTYTVTAIGEGGYRKILSAVFTLTPPEDNVYMRVTENEYYVLLTVWTEQVTGEAKVTFPDTLLPDNTDPVLRDVNQGDGVFTDSQGFTQAYASRTYRFFKTHGEDTYTPEDFGVSIGDAYGVQAAED